MKKLVMAICCIGFANLSYAQNDVLCEALVNYSLNGSNLEITDAEWFEERSLPGGFNGPGINLPPHCHVEGVIDRRIGVNDVEYNRLVRRELVVIPDYCKDLLLSAMIPGMRLKAPLMRAFLMTRKQH